MEGYQKFETLGFSRPAEGVLQIQLRNPRRLNAVDAAMHRHLAQVWPVVNADPQTRAVLVCGAEGQFSAGGSFDLIEQMVEDYAVLVRVWQEARDLVYNLVNCDKPVVAAIEGVAVGAGLAVALLADISVAAEDARLLDGHTRLGVAAGDHAVMVWPLLMGLAKAKYHLLLNEPISGAQAEAMGMVSLAIPAAQVYPRALEIAVKLAGGAPAALRWTKYALNNWLRMAGPAFDASLALEFLGFRGPDVREGLDSLREKRPPRWSMDGGR